MIAVIDQHFPTDYRHMYSHPGSTSPSVTHTGAFHLQAEARLFRGSHKMRNLYTALRDRTRIGSFDQHILAPISAE